MRRRRTVFFGQHRGFHCAVLPLVRVAVLHRDHGVVIAVHGADQSAYLLRCLGRSLAAGEGQHRVEDQVIVCGAPDHAEVVDGQTGIHLLHHS